MEFAARAHEIRTRSHMFDRDSEARDFSVELTATDQPLDVEWLPTEPLPDFMPLSPKSRRYGLWSVPDPTSGLSLLLALDYVGRARPGRVAPAPVLEKALEAIREDPRLWLASFWMGVDT